MSAEAENEAPPPAHGPQRLSRPLPSLPMVERHRNLHCKLYDTCLDGVVDGRWRGWSCRFCPRFHEQPKPERMPSLRRRW